MTEPRRLRGHKAAATCCISSRRCPGVVVTSGEDGSMCWFDMRCKDVLSVMDVGNGNPISSLCFKAGNEDIIYASFGNEVKCFDVHMAATWKPLESFKYNKEEINQIACNSRSTFLALADDSGEVKIIDMQQKCLYKTLRAGHTSICSSVQFVPWRPWECIFFICILKPVHTFHTLLTGGLDSKLVMWDFSKGRPYKTMDFGLPGMGSRSNLGQLLNPAFVHAIAVPEADMLDALGKICIMARGDGVVDVINVESAQTVVRSRNSSKSQKGSRGKVKEKSTSKDGILDDQADRNNLQLDYSFGGHTAAVSCVNLSLFGEKGKFMISGGNDKLVKVWDMFKCIDGGQSNNNTNLLHLDINTSRKVNWLCTTPTDAENLVVCDTSKVVKVYTVA